MATTQVHGCDWCGDIVPKDNDGIPQFAAKIVSRILRLSPGSLAAEPKTHLICRTCHTAFKALTEGKYRR